MIAQGLAIMGIGMTVVFLFIIFLVMVMYGMASVLQKYGLESSGCNLEISPRLDDDALVAVAISTAYNNFRKLQAKD